MRKNLKTIMITRLIRPMRGGAQSHLVQGEDGRFYVAKFCENPQGNRTLINECIVSHIMQRLEICTPELRVLQLPENFREKLHFTLNSGNRQIRGDFHLGSLVPVDPEKTAIFDSLPRNLLPRIINLSDFASALVVDKWVYNTDKRQVVFTRARGVKPVGFCAHMIDHGQAFDGVWWEFRNREPMERNWLRHIYRLLDLRAECVRTLGLISGLTRDDLDETIRKIPESWFENDDRTRLADLMRQLWVRHNNLEAIVAHDLEVMDQFP